MIALTLALGAFPSSETQCQSEFFNHQSPQSARPTLVPNQAYIVVVIVKFEALSGSTKQELEDIIDRTNADDLRELQNAVGQCKQALLTLASVGMNPTQVVAVGVTPDGILTLVVQPTA